MVFKIFGGLVTFSFYAVLAKYLGADGSGTFLLAYSILAIVALVGRLGMDNVLIKFIGYCDASRGMKRVWSIYKQAVLISGSASLVLMVILMVYGGWIAVSVFDNTLLSEVLPIFSLSVVPITLIGIHGFALQGIKRIAESIFINNIGLQILMILVVVFFAHKFGLVGIAWGYLFSSVVILLAGGLLWVRAIDDTKSGVVEYGLSDILGSSMPLLLMGLFQLVTLWTSTILLGVLIGSNEVGIYNAANRTAMLNSFVLVAFNVVAAPMYASLHRDKDIKGMEVIAMSSTRVLLVLAAPFFLVCMFFSDDVMGLYGLEFKQGALALSILSVGQFVNVAAGSVGYLLIMSGNEKLMRNIFAVCAITSVFFNVILIPRFGVVGAATSTAITLIIQNILAVLLVRKVLNIRTFPTLTLGLSKWI
jgi:O-antigen/teichoic acid export membrane protein